MLKMIFFQYLGPESETDVTVFRRLHARQLRRPVDRLVHQLRLQNQTRFRSASDRGMTTLCCCIRRRRCW